MKMDMGKELEGGRKELEDGEIEENEEISESNSLDASNNINKNQSYRKPQFVNKNQQKSWRKSERKSESSHKLRDTNSKENKEKYEMDEFQLLLARHQLIQQQLQKVNATENNKVNRKTKLKKKKKKAKELSGTLPTAPKEVSSGNNESSQTEVGEDEDTELLEMRKALLAQTTKKNIVGEMKDKEINTNKNCEISNRKKLYLQFASKAIEPNEKKGTAVALHIDHKSSPDTTKSNVRTRSQTRKHNLLALQQQTNKKRKRGGKRAKYLAYRAQQKKELELFEQQQAKTFDNYNSVPMEIDNDEENDVCVNGIAPLPLIETVVNRPPLPPADGFYPVQDQTSLSMTSFNVAWMPGYVETLEADTTVKNTYTAEKVEEKTKKSIPDKDVEIDEKEVYALRAQALKSLAYKRASKVKQAKLSKMGENDNKEATTSVKVSVSTPINTSELFTKYQPPIHASVIIRLGKEDFDISDEEEDTQRFADLRKKIKGPIQRRKSLTDEELLKELQNYTKKANEKVRSHSLLVQQDQVRYRKLHSELIEKRGLFRKQDEKVKALQAKLQAAVKEKASTRRSYNTLHTEIKDVKLKLKKKISVRKRVEEQLLKAKSVVSVKKLNVDEQGKLGTRVQQNIATLNESLKNTCADLLKIEQESHDSSFDYEPTFEDSVTNHETNNSVLQRTAASVKNMSKQDLAKLELELREQLKRYRKLQENTSSTDNVDSGDDQKIIITRLPAIDTKKLLSELRESMPQTQLASNPCYSVLVEELQKQKDVIPKTSLVGGELTKQTRDQKQHSVVDNNKYKETGSKYKSQLLRFKSYRLNPYFRSQSKYSIQSKTFSNRIKAHKIMCKYDIHGKCNDDKCSYWHFKDTCELSTNEMFCDLIAYDLIVFDATPSMSVETKLKLLQSFAEQFHTQYNSKMSRDQLLLLLWNQLKENRRGRKIPMYECISFDDRNWFSVCRLPQQQQQQQQHEEWSHLTNEHIFATVTSSSVYHLKTSKEKTNNLSIADNYESQEVRYFSETYRAIDIMESSLKENPKDVKLWLSLARYYLKQQTDDAEPNKNVENALSVLSRSLETNRDSEELWIEYLKLFANNSTADELRELSYQAVMYAATYNVWWTCLTLEMKYVGKQEICTEMIKFIIESDDVIESKSNSLLEVLLYLCKLLEGRDKRDIALKCFMGALGKEDLNDEVEKISIGSIVTHFTTYDLCVMWMCYISLLSFHQIPECLFSEHTPGAGRLVNKKKFTLNWNDKTRTIHNDKIRSLFYSALDSFPDKLVSNVTKKTKMLIYENLVGFELSLGNIQAAVDVIRSVVDEEENLVEAWVLLLLLYMKYSPMDIVVKIAEEALHKCEHDVVVVYFYSSWLYEQGMPRLALEKLTKCIHVYFQFGTDKDVDNVPDILYLYKKVLGLEIPYTTCLPTYMPKASQELNFYYWLCYCLVLKIQDVPPCSDAIEMAFEVAVHQYTSRDNNKKLWTAYIEHKLQPLTNQETSISVASYNEIVDLVCRAIVAVPSTTLLQDNSSVLWKDFSFHNNIISKCLPFIPASHRSQFYQKLIYLMPNNVCLAIRICQHEVTNGNAQQARIICGGLLQSHPRCLQLWRMAIGVECKLKRIKEARWMYEEAVKTNSHCSILWKEYAQFEIKFTVDAYKLNEALDKIYERASANGIELEGYLSKLAIK